MSTKDTSPPTLAEQIAAVRGWLDYETNENGSLVWEKEMRAILASLERLATEQEFHNIDDVVKIRELESQLATLHSQIDGLMKRLLREEADSKRRHELLKLCHADAVRLYDGLFTAVNGVIGPRHMKLLRDHYSYSRTAQSGSGEAARQGCSASQGGGDG